ncbi:MAG: amidohydrolase [Gemmatimonadetes bacterium]|nr:amidohydrolase [Gemmatimonadota bacterium]
MRSLRPAALACLFGFGAGAGPVLAQTPIDSMLFRHIRSIRAFDNHAHPIRPTRPDEPPDTDFDALPIGGIPPFDFPTRLRGDNPELIEAWRDLYGYPHSDRTEAHLAELKSLKARIKTEQGSRYAEWVLDRLGIEVQIANRMSVGPGLAPPRFRWVGFVDPLMLPLSVETVKRETPDRLDLYPRQTGHLRRYLADLGLAAIPATLDGYLAKVVTPTLERMKAQGAVAVKYEAAYLRPLSFEPASRAAAARVYASGGAPSFATYKTLQDFLFEYIGIEAGRLGLPVHIHSSDGAGGYFQIRGSDPLQLEPALNNPKLRQTTFVIVHGGWPNTRGTMSLMARPNVYADFSFLGNLLSAATIGSVLREWLSAYPERILFGSDAYPDNELVGWEEWGWLGTTAGRRGLAVALTGMMLDGEISRARAEEIARAVMRDNGMRLYRLDGR